MSVPQEQFDDLLQRTALASLFYYPEVAVDDTDYSLEKDVDYCLEPMSGLDADDLSELRTIVGRVITNPSAHRAELIELVIELAPEPAEE
jgi:hypothetical protein